MERYLNKVAHIDSISFSDIKKLFFKILINRIKDNCVKLLLTVSIIRPVFMSQNLMMGSLRNCSAMVSFDINFISLYFILFRPNFFFNSKLTFKIELGVFTINHCVSGDEKTVESNKKFDRVHIVSPVLPLSLTKTDSKYRLWFTRRNRKINYYHLKKNLL